MVTIPGASAWAGPSVGQYRFFSNDTLEVRDLSPDGSTIVGSYSNSANFHFSEATGFTIIGDHNIVGVTNGPDQMMIGTTDSVCFGLQLRTECAIVTRNNSATPVGALDECGDGASGVCLDSFGAGIASSSRTVVGFRRFLVPLPQNACNTEVCAAIFDSEWAPLPKIPITPNSDRSLQTIRGIDDAGIHVVGSGVNPNGATEAYLVTRQSITPLGDLAGGVFQSSASAISGNGAFVVGTSRSDAGLEAFIWTNGVMQGLGDLPGGAFSSEALDVSDNGVVVGRGTGEPGDLNAGGAFLWRADVGMRPMRQVLQEEYGFFFPESTYGAFLSGVAISADGNHIVIKTSTGTLLVHLPIIPPIPGDVNNDGFVDLADIDAFILALTRPMTFFNVYPGGELQAADVNGDGVRDGRDIAAFLELIAP